MGGLSVLVLSTFVAVILMEVQVQGLFIAQCESICVMKGRSLQERMRCIQEECHDRLDHNYQEKKKSSSEGLDAKRDARRRDQQKMAICQETCMYGAPSMWRMVFCARLGCGSSSG